MNTLPHQKHGLILFPIAPNIEVIFPAHLRRADVPNRKQFREFPIDLAPSRQRITEEVRDAFLERAGRFAPYLQHCGYTAEIA